MSGTEQAQISWIKDKLGVDIEDVRRRGRKVSKAIGEIEVQAEVREALGYDDQALKLRESSDKLGERKLSTGDEATTLDEYKALGTVKQDAQAVIPALVA